MITPASLRRGALAATIVLASTAAYAQASTLITGALVIDGTGTPGTIEDVRIIGDRIADVGILSQRQGETVLRANGLVLAPGFIDTHSHADDGIFDHPDALADVSQGITTVVVGQDGGSMYPLADFFAKLAKQPATVNVASYTGHGTLRERVLGKDYKRFATPAEVAQMTQLLDADMREGSLGLSSGLEYDPGIYSDSTELFGLTRGLGAQHGRYISHIRSEDYAFWQAIHELLAIGEHAKIPVQVSHIKLAIKANWGLADSLVGVLDAARARGIDVTADIYPYTYWHSDLSVLIPSRNFGDRSKAAFALANVVPATGLTLTEYGPNPAYVGHTLHEIAAMRHEDDTTALMALEQQSDSMSRAVGHGVDGILGESMIDQDIARLLQWPYSDICTDGELDGAHPRGFGAFTRVLGTYVRERHAIPLEEAVRKMTTLAASNVGIGDRGQVSVGMFADLVLFDPTTVADRATLQAPHAVSAGIRATWVNGVLVYRDGAATAARPGRVLRRGGE